MGQALEEEPEKESLETARIISLERAVRIREAYENAANRFRARPSALDRSILITFKSMRDPLLKSRVLGCWRLEQFVQSSAFARLAGTVVLANAIFVGITSHMSMQRAIVSYDMRAEQVEVGRPLWVDTIDLLFTLVFAAEILLRAVGLEGQFLNGSDWKWNVFDVLLTAMGLLEIALRNLTDQDVRAIGVIQVFRTARLLRLLRFSHLVPKLRLMTLAIVNCSAMLMWAVVVVVLLVFIFSIVFLHGAVQYISSAGDGDAYAEEMVMFFGSLSMAMLTLFMAVSGGIDWWDVVKLLLEVHVAYASVFVVFVVITVLAVLNVINAIFVNDAMESTRKDFDLRTQGELEDTRFMLERLTVLFHDLQRGGTVLDTEFVSQVEEYDVKMQFALLGLHFTDGRNFFKLLDVDRNGSLAIDEFVMGCLRLKGGALLIDSNVLIQETKSMLQVTASENRKALASLARVVKDLREKVGKCAVTERADIF